MRRLSALSLSGVTLTPAFASGTTAYTASVAHGVTETTETASARATPMPAWRSRRRTLMTRHSETRWPWWWGRQRSASQVTAQDGETTQDLHSDRRRGPGRLMRRLSALSLSGVTLTPAFAAGTTAYTASVASTRWRRRR